MERNCAVCVYAKLLNDDKNVLCEKNGVVPLVFSCKKQKTDLTKVKVRRKRDIAKPEY
ncbi:MAG: hypothetical protein IJN39_01305 [Clostridia bacterium]|nr:hypothetical protein [Clostridia bacterium]